MGSYVTFYIVDDDRASRSILTEIIEQENLGEVIGYGKDGADQDIAILQAKPQIVLIDLLMPQVDGIALTNKLRHQGYKGHIVMISQVESKEMVAKAYETGVEFYITKPINRTEVISVLRQLIFIYAVQSSLELAQEKIHSYMGTTSKDESIASSGESLEKLQKKLNHLFYHLGILGSSGANDLAQIIIYLYLKKGTRAQIIETSLNLHKLYREVLLHSKGNGEATEEEVKAMEQRLRRTIKNCLDNIAAMGLADYYDPRFERFSSTLFDFIEVRNRMEELRKDTKYSKTKIHIKKFIQAIYIEVTSMSM